MRETERKFQLTWLMRGLALGPPPGPSAFKALREDLGITALVDTRTSSSGHADAAAWMQAGVEVLRLPSASERNQSVELLQRGVEWMDARLCGAGKVFIVCEGDAVQSPMLALCLLVHKGQAPLDAFEQMKRARPELSPSPEQLEVFRAWTRQQLRLGRASWPVPPFMQLAKIAYSHLKVMALSS